MTKKQFGIIFTLMALIVCVGVLSMKLNESGLTDPTDLGAMLLDGSEEETMSTQDYFYNLRTQKAQSDSKIKEEMKKESNETYTYTTGITFTETHRGSRFSQDKYFKNVKESINKRIDGIKDQAVRDLRSFVARTLRAYTNELRQNADAKKAELHKVMDAKKNAEEIMGIIDTLTAKSVSVEIKNKCVTELKGGIECNV